MPMKHNGGAMPYSVLVERFHSQAAFAGGIKSLLYQRLFATVGEWLKDRPDDQISKWLAHVHETRSDLEVSLLFMAGIHREVLLKRHGTAKLREFYPSAGGTKPSTDLHLPTVFLDTAKELLASPSLSDFMLNANVQTNETGRGIFWLLPVALTGWNEIHLADLGASAGLNLVADQRKYTFVDRYNGDWSIGKANACQFTILSEPMIPTTLKDSIPHVLSRSGCDLFPFSLKSEQDKATLASYVFADQTHRIKRLQEGIEAFKCVEEVSPIALSRINLPDELPLFLGSLRHHQDEAPVVLYNTFMTAYLRNQGQDLKTHIDAWAKNLEKPVLWAQLEPPSDGRKPPELYWCAWTLHLWENGQSHQWQIGWVHPHGTTVIWDEDNLQSFTNHFD